MNFRPTHSRWQLFRCVCECILSAYSFRRFHSPILFRFFARSFKAFWALELQLLLDMMRNWKTILQTSSGSLVLLMALVTEVHATENISVPALGSSPTNDLSRRYFTFSGNGITHYKARVLYNMDQLPIAPQAYKAPRRWIFPLPLVFNHRPIPTAFTIECAR